MFDFSPVQILKGWRATFLFRFTWLTRGRKPPPRSSRHSSMFLPRRTLHYFLLWHEQCASRPVCFLISPPSGIQIVPVFQSPWDSSSLCQVLCGFFFIFKRKQVHWLVPWVEVVSLERKQTFWNRKLLRYPDSSPSFCTESCIESYLAV